MQKPCVPNTSKQMQAVFYRKSAKKATDFAPSREIFWLRGAFLASLGEGAKNVIFTNGFPSTQSYTIHPKS